MRIWAALIGPTPASVIRSSALNADSLITHRFAFADAVKAVEAMQRRDEPMWTVVNP